jgi:hypothetical protein
MNDGVGNVRPQPKQEKDGGESEDAERQAQKAAAGDSLVQTSQHHAEDKAGHEVRQRRELERLQPGRRAREAVGCGMPSGLRWRRACRGSCPWPRRRPAARACGQGARAASSAPAREEQVVKRLGRHGPRRSVQEGGDLRNPALQQQRRQDHPGPEHAVSMGRRIPAESCARP